MTGMKKMAWFATLLIAGLAVGCGSSSSKGTKDGGSTDGGGTDGGGAVCGNGIVEPGEQCDDGNTTNGDGCQSDCTFTCSTDADCDDGVTCDGTETCSQTLHVCQRGTNAQNGTNCQFTVTSTSADGGVADAGTDGGAVQTILGRCIDGACGRPCTMDADCDDGNPCNGTETCDPTYKSCAPGTPPSCDDGEVCTADTCDPESGCVHTLTNDADGDGFVASGITCTDHSLEGDCNDNDPTVYPGAPELCDGKDNNCNGQVDEVQPFWYLDCDGDGYAAMGAASTQSCAEPAPQGGCGWTTTVPSMLSTTDCDDSNANVNPGHTTYEAKPYCKGANATAQGSAPPFNCSSSGGTLSWDWNCNAQSDERYTVVSGGSCGLSTCLPGVIICRYGCSGSGWDNGYAPSCGYSSTYLTCGGFPLLGGGCTSSTGTQQQTCR